MRNGIPKQVNIQTNVFQNFNTILPYKKKKPVDAKLIKWPCTEEVMIATVWPKFFPFPHHFSMALYQAFLPLITHLPTLNNVSGGTAWHLMLSILFTVSEISKVVIVFIDFLSSMLETNTALKLFSMQMF